MVNIVVNREAMVIWEIKETRNEVKGKGERWERENSEMIVLRCNGKLFKGGEGYS
jgi:hypothetical protein